MSASSRNVRQNVLLLFPARKKLIINQFLYRQFDLRRLRVKRLDMVHHFPYQVLIRHHLVLFHSHDTEGLSDLEALSFYFLTDSFYRVGNTDHDFGLAALWLDIESNVLVLELVRLWRRHRLVLPHCCVLCLALLADGLLWQGWLR